MESVGGRSGVGEAWGEKRSGSDWEDIGAGRPIKRPMVMEMDIAFIATGLCPTIAVRVDHTVNR